MPTRDHYEHGVPNWVDLMTPDTERSRAFYAGLFGWEYTENPTGEDSPPYVMALKEGKPVAGMMQRSEADAAAGMPPMWSTYIAVDDIDATFAKVAPAGGQEMMPPMQVMEAGKMALLADPTGAVVGLWERGEHIGAELVNEHGAVTWNELQTPDPDAASAFYAEVLGWGTESMDMGPAGTYTVYTVGENGIGGAMKPPQPGVPPHWSVVFATDDADATAATAQELGGTVHAEPFDMPIGRLTVIADIHGSIFQAIKLDQPPA